MALFQQGACLSTQPFSSGPARFKAVFMEFVIRRRLLFCLYFTVTEQHAEGETPQSSQTPQILCAGSSFWTEYNQSLFLMYTTQWFLGYSHRVMRPPPLSPSRGFSSPQRETPPLVADPPTPPPPLLCSLGLWICLFCTFHINRLIHHVTFCVGFFHTAACFQGSSCSSCPSFLFMPEQYSIEWIDAAFCLSFTS